MNIIKKGIVALTLCGLLSGCSAPKKDPLVELYNKDEPFSWKIFLEETDNNNSLENYSHDSDMPPPMNYLNFRIPFHLLDPHYGPQDSFDPDQQYSPLDAIFEGFCKGRGFSFPRFPGIFSQKSLEESLQEIEQLLKTSQNSPLCQDKSLGEYKIPEKVYQQVVVDLNHLVSHGAKIEENISSVEILIPELGREPGTPLQTYFDKPDLLVLSYPTQHHSQTTTVLSYAGSIPHIASPLDESIIQDPQLLLSELLLLEKLGLVKDHITSQSLQGIKRPAYRPSELHSQLLTEIGIRIAEEKDIDHIYTLKNGQKIHLYECRTF